MGVKEGFRHYLEASVEGKLVTREEVIREIDQMIAEMSPDLDDCVPQEESPAYQVMQLFQFFKGILEDRTADLNFDSILKNLLHFKIEPAVDSRFFLYRESIEKVLDLIQEVSFAESKEDKSTGQLLMISILPREIARRVINILGDGKKVSVPQN